MYRIGHNNKGKGLYEYTACLEGSVIKLENGEIRERKPFKEWHLEQEHANRFYGTEQPLAEFVADAPIGLDITLEFWENPGMEFKQSNLIKVIKVIGNGKDENGFYVDLIFKNHDEHGKPYKSLVH